MKQVMPEPLPTAIPLLPFLFLFSKNSYPLIFPSFLLKLIHLCLVMSLGFDHLPTWSLSQPINPTTITQTYIYFLSYSFLICLLSLDPFPPFIPFYILHYFIYFISFLNCYNPEKLEKCLVWRSSSMNKEWNIMTKPVVSVWFIHFSTCFYHLVRFTKIYHFSIWTKVIRQIQIFFFFFFFFFFKFSTSFNLRSSSRKKTFFCF